MAFPQVTFTNTSGETSNVTTHTVSLPATVAANDFLLIFAGINGTPSITPPSGWTTLLDLPGTNCKLAIFKKKAAGTEGGTTVTFGTGAGENSSHCAYAGDDWSEDINDIEISTGATGSNTAPDSDSVTASWGSDENLFISAYGLRRGRTISTYPSSYTGNQLESRGIDSTGGSSAACASRELNASNDDPGVYAIISSSPWAAATVVIKPASGSAPVLSLPTPSGTLGTTTTATLGATTDVASGTFYGVVDTAGNISGITAAQIKAGDNNGDTAAVASSNSVVSTTTPSTGVTGLSANTLYSYAVAQNAVAGDSNVLTGTFTTAATAPPVVTGGTDPLESDSTNWNMTGTSLDETTIASIEDSTSTYSAVQTIDSQTAGQLGFITVSDGSAPTQLPFTDTNWTIRRKVTDGVTPNTDDFTAFDPPSTQQQYPLSLATALVATAQSAFNTLTIANANQCTWPASYAGGTITPETSGGESTGRFSVSGNGDGSFTVRLWQLGTWSDISMTTESGVIVSAIVSNRISIGIGIGI